MRIVLTKDKAKAEQAKKALESGDSWKEVAKKYSIDTQSKSQGGKLPPVSKGQQEKALDDAIFSAKKGELVGPVKTQFGYYDFEVDKVTPASQQTLAAGDADDQAAARRAEPAEGARRVRQEVPRQVEGQDRVPRGLQDARLQERPEGDADAEPGRSSSSSSRSRRASATRGPRVSASPDDVADAVARLDALTRRLRARVPVGPRAGRALDRPAHARGGLRAGGGGPRRRRRQAARRARRRAVPGPLPLAAARGARRGDDGRRRRAHPPEADPPASARVRGHGSRDRRRGPAQLGRDQARGAGARAGHLRRGPGEPPVAAVRAQGPAPRRVDAASTSTTCPTRAVRGELDELEAAERARGALPRGRRRAVRGGQRRAQAARRSRARAARRERALPRPRRGRLRPRRTRRRGLERSGPRRPARLLRTRPTRRRRRPQ